MALNNRGIFHPKFTRAIGRVAEGAMTASVLIRRVNPEVQPGWTFESGMPQLDGRFTDILRARARVQPNLDWRAKGYNIGNATTVFQAVKVDIPMAERIWVNDELDEIEVLDGDQIIVEDVYFPAIQPLTKFVFTVRNPVNSSNAPQWNILCDLDLKSRI